MWLEIIVIFIKIGERKKKNRKAAEKAKILYKEKWEEMFLVKFFLGKLYVRDLIKK